MKLVMFLILALGGCSFSGEVEPDIQCSSSCEEDQQSCYTDCDTECANASEDGDEACDEDCKTTCDESYDECTVTCTSE